MSNEETLRLARFLESLTRNRFLRNTIWLVMMGFFLDLPVALFAYDHSAVTFFVAAVIGAGLCFLVGYYAAVKKTFNALLSRSYLELCTMNVDSEPSLPLVLLKEDE